jgi:hypothetical protein
MSMQGSSKSVNVRAELGCGILGMTWSAMCSTVFILIFDSFQLMKE